MSDKRAKPNIYRYHDYREFLKDWLAWLKASQSGFSLRRLAAKADLALGYLPMVIKRSRNLSPNALAKLLPHLGLGSSERSYLVSMVQLGDAENQEERVASLGKMKRFPGYRKNNGREAETFQYLTHWYYVAIREMAMLPGFRPDPAWIRPRLRSRVSTQDIAKALRFLADNGYLEISSDGTTRPPERSLDCLGGVYKIALTQMHQEMLSLASRSIESTPALERNILGYTFALDAAGLDQARAILDDTYAKLRDLARESRSGKAVYHAEMALFPLTRSMERSDDDQEQS